MNMETHEVIPNSIASGDFSLIFYTQSDVSYVHNKDHLLLELPILVILWAHFPIKVVQLFKLFVP
jgi:hypothetical protein